MLLEWCALAAALVVAVPIGVLTVECVAALLAPRDRPLGDGPRIHGRPRVCVLTPAHNEERWIHTALDSVLPQLGPRDRMLVVAHNCHDRTAEHARAAGADVLEWRDHGTGGKPDALKAGLKALEEDPPEVVVIVDADCVAAPGAVEALAYAACAHDAPVQGVYLFAPAGGERLSSVSSLALLLKNVVRPLGLARLGLPCLLNGAGSAYPYRLLRDAPHGEGSIAEDYQLSIDLALAGRATRFCPTAEVTSVLPTAQSTAYKQRKRWEHGHLRLFLGTAPRLFFKGIAREDIDLVALAVDLCVPPLSFLALWWLATAALGGASLALGGSATPLIVSAITGGLMLVGVVGSLARFAGPRAALGLVLAVPRYVLWKLPLYVAYLFRRETRWRKTERR